MGYGREDILRDDCGEGAVMDRRILGLGAFPLMKPIHGGQRRVAAIKRFYESIGIQYDYACVYDPASYTSTVVSANDIPLGPPVAEYKSVPFIGDLLAGWQAANEPQSLKHFLGVIDRIKPDALQLEHPFMWPLAQQLLTRPGTANLPIIYSSHNVEAPLKKSILAKAGVARHTCDQISERIQDMEIELCAYATLVICVSKSDRQYYANFRPEADVVVVPNGVDRAPAVISDSAGVREVFGQNRYLFMVGSAYPPNIEGTCNLVMRDGAFHGPPSKSLAICGGMSDGIFNHAEYRRFAAANDCRVHFFPTIEDDDLWALKVTSHGAIVAVDPGSGGTSLKTAEALALGKWVIANSAGLRGFEDFADDEGVVKADDRTDFRRSIAKVLRSAPLEISAQSHARREALYWDRCFSDSTLADRLSQLPR
jgi:glycosyltransferase involved in cell wall biosynthesis